MKKKILILSFLLISCAGKDRDTSSKLRVILEKGDYIEAEKFSADTKFYDEERNDLLRVMEKGTIYYLQKKHKEALENFYLAKEISDNLFTVSISKKIASTTISTSIDNYYGEKYERSLIRFYLSLIHYNLYKETNDRKHLTSARANVLEWDSLLNSYKAEDEGKSTYKSDITQKVWAAFIHKEVGTNNDKQIALQLYKDAKDVLFKNYNAYPTYNNKAKDFDDDFKKLSKLPIEKVKKDYVDNTIFAKNLIDFLDKEIKLLQQKKDNNLIIVLKDGLINHKKAKRVVIGFNDKYRTKTQDVDEISLILPLTTLATIRGDPILMVLGLLAIEFSFEVPSVPEYVNNMNLEGILYKNGIEISRFPLIITSPINDIAQKEINDKFTSQLIKTATTTVAKHVAAIIMAKGIYNATLKQGKIWANLAAMASYKGASMAINKSAEADLRYWSSLPYNIRIGETNVPNGEYDFVVNASYLTEKKEYEIYREKLNVKGKTFKDLNISHMK
ncbi:MAG: hypothetical protein LBT02_03000 [Rickettsiales bacterium]|jgi:hypothetical protein|nr:hypothetical protein [Rickettsiales bacterium]